MKARVGKMTSGTTLITAILCLGLSSIQTVLAAHPWVSTATKAASCASTSTATSRRRFSAIDPTAVLPMSSKTKKHANKDEEDAAETHSPKRQSFFFRSSTAKNETETTAGSEPEDKPNNKRKKPSWKEIRKPKADESAQEKQPRFRFGNRTSKQSKSAKEDSPTPDDMSTTEDKEEKPKRKSRFQLAIEARQERQKDNEPTASNTTNTEKSTSNVTSMDEATNETSTNANNYTSISNTNSTSASNTTVISFGVPPRSMTGTRYPQPIIYHRPYPSRQGGGISIDGPGGHSSMPSNTALFATAIVSVLGVVSRLWLVLFITNKLASDAEELLPPVQHFVWECLNDKYSKDARIFGKALSQPPMGFTKRQWKAYLRQENQEQKRLRKQEKESALLQRAQDDMDCSNSTREESNPKAVVSASESLLQNPISSILGRQPPDFPTQTTIVVDLTPKNEQLNLSYISDVVNLLIQVHSSKNHNENLDGRLAPIQTEVVLLLTSPGGAVSTYGLAAAEVARLEKAGIRTTVCVDQVAASGGYMIASQTSQILAAPFAMVGSIGVIQEGLNFNKLLEKYGVKPLVLKAGKHKRQISTFGHVSDKDVQDETKRMEEVHEAFIELCTSHRPSLDPTICDGTVLLASRALECGLVDRILTSDEYLWERVCAGDHVLKLHRTTRTDQRRIFVRALDLLPHLKGRIQGRNLQKVVGHLVQGYAFFSMVRHQFFPNLSHHH